MTEIEKSTSPFDAIRRVRTDGSEYWSARDMQPLMGYSQWVKLEVPLNRAMSAARNQGLDVEANFSRSGKVSGRRGPARKDYELSRSAAYLLAMNGDPNKPEIAAAQMYFAVKTRQAEIAQSEPLTEIEIARQYLAAVEEKVRLAGIVAAQAPKVIEHDAFMDSGASAEYPTRAVAKSIGMGPSKILSAMRLLDVAYNQTASHDSGWHLMQKYIDAGWGRERLTRWENGRGQSWAIYLTAKGVSNLFNLLHDEGYDVYWPEDLLGRA